MDNLNINEELLLTLPISENAKDLVDHNTTKLPILNDEILPIQGQYTILQKLGSGFTANVYKALQLKTNKIIAIKYISKERLRLFGNEEQFKKIFNIMKTINNPHIVKYYQLLEDSSALFLVMECCDGGSVAGAIENCIDMGSSDLIKRIMYQLLQAVKILHNDGVNQNIKIQHFQR